MTVDYSNTLAKGVTVNALADYTLCALRCVFSYQSLNRPEDEHEHRLLLGLIEPLVVAVLEDPPEEEYAEPGRPHRRHERLHELPRRLLGAERVARHGQGDVGDGAGQVVVPLRLEHDGRDGHGPVDAEVQDEELGVRAEGADVGHDDQVFGRVEVLGQVKDRTL